MQTSEPFQPGLLANYKSDFPAGKAEYFVSWCGDNRKKSNLWSSVGRHLKEISHQFYDHIIKGFN